MAVQYAFGKIITQGLDLNVDAADPTSYPGSGTSWTNVVNRSITGSLISCSFSSDFKGGIVFNNPTASVQFPGTVANYGTGSFTVEMAFRPTQIQGIHYLVSKNSGSFPNWGVYLSGSGGSGKLFAEYRISSTVSCSVSSSATFVTGSNYFIDVNFSPFSPSIIQYSEGGIIGVNTGNNTGSLSTTSSLFIGNIIQSSSFSFSGSIYNLKSYLNNNTFLPYNNFNNISTRLGLTKRPVITVEYLLVGGGGGSPASNPGGGGGGAGGLLTGTALVVSNQTLQVNVGDGGTTATNGGNSSFLSFIAFGGGFGGGGNGGSGGGVTSGTGGLGVPGQGNSGGISITNYSGGGGAGTSGSSNGIPGSGSFQPNFLVAGSPAGWYAGGGAGGGGFGIYITNNVRGGGGSSTSGNVNGTPNTGGGGSAYEGTKGKGGSGIIILRYQSVTPLASGGTVTTVGDYTYHTFTATGSSTFTVF